MQHNTIINCINLHKNKLQRRDEDAAQFPTVVLTMQNNPSKRFRVGQYVMHSSSGVYRTMSGFKLLQASEFCARQSTTGDEETIDIPASMTEDERYGRNTCMLRLGMSCSTYLFNLTALSTYLFNLTALPTSSISLLYLTLQSGCVLHLLGF